MKIFITGCTAPQSAVSANDRSPAFAGFLSVAFKNLGYEIVWEDPSVNMTKEFLSQFDYVFVGVSSPISTASHRAYGAFSVINTCYDLDNLVLFVDSPEPAKVWSGIRAIYNNPKSFIKPFYSSRREYDKVKNIDIFNNVISGIEKLFINQWPKTFIPGYPWTDKSVFQNYIPNVDTSDIHMVIPDSLPLSATKMGIDLVDEGFWVVDNSSTPWSQKTIELLTREHFPLRPHNWASQSEILDRLSKSIGAIVSVYKDDKSWWLPSISQALYVGVPVVTEWRNTEFLGPEWTYIATNIEEMSSLERSVVAEQQLISYRNALPAWEDVCVSIANAIDKKDYAKK